jgi:hypothetical protein
VSHLQGSVRHCVAIKMKHPSQNNVQHCTTSVQLKDTFETSKLQSQDGHQRWFDIVNQFAVLIPTLVVHCTYHISMLVQAIRNISTFVTETPIVNVLFCRK